MTFCHLFETPCILHNRNLLTLTLGTQTLVLIWEHLSLCLDSFSGWSSGSAQAACGTDDNQDSERLRTEWRPEKRENDGHQSALLFQGSLESQCFHADGIKCFTNVGYYQMPAITSLSPGHSLCFQGNWEIKYHFKVSYLVMSKISFNNIIQNPFT